MAEESTPTQRASKNWRTGVIGLPALVGLLLVLGAGGLAAASIGGWGSVALVAVLMLAFIGLITSWSVSN